jgi:HK97 gp10 family phage protein
MPTKIKGADRLAATTAAAGRDLAAMPRGTHAAAANVAAARTRANAPRRTGRLVGSVGVQVTGSGASVTVGAPYAAFVEYGTRYMRGRRFVSAAADDSLDDVADVYMAQVDRTMKTIKGA